MGHALYLHARRHPRPLPPDARLQRALAAWHRPCRHRDADGGRAPAQAKGESRTPSGARRSSSGFGRGRRKRGDDPAPAATCSAHRPTGRASGSRWTRGCPARCARPSSTSTSGASIYRDKRLINWDPRPYRTLRSRGARTREAKGELFEFAIRSRKSRAARSSSRRRARRRCWATPPWPCTRTTRATRHLHGKRMQAPVRRARDPHRHGSTCRPEVRHRRGQGDARARLQRLRDRQAPRARRDQHLRPRRHAQREAPEAFAGWTAEAGAREGRRGLEEMGLARRVEDAHAHAARRRALRRGGRAVI